MNFKIILIKSIRIQYKGLMICLFNFKLSCVDFFEIIKRDKNCLRTVFAITNYKLCKK